MTIKGSYTNDCPGCSGTLPEKLIQPLPWHAGPHQGVFGGFGVFDSNDVIVFGNVTADEARFIVTACNAHADLLAALKALFDDYKQLADSGDAGFWALEDKPAGQQALAAIAKAEGRA